MIPPKVKIRLNEIEVNLDYQFKDLFLLMRALTHVSAVGGTEPRLLSYQRLEFLGDHVLGLVVSDMLYETFGHDDEGGLSRRLAELVRAETCAEIALELGLDIALRLGQSEMNAGVRKKQAVLSDICESVIGAVFLDGGYKAADILIKRLWDTRMHHPKRRLRDAKTALQEWAQAQSLAIPNYVEIGRTGPDHAPVFNIEVQVKGYDKAFGEATSKRAAEQLAAENFLKREDASELLEDE